MAVSFENVGIIFKLLCILICCNGYFCTRANMKIEKSHTTDFDVKPGGVIQEFEEHLGDITCKFIYACQGGTKESWSLTIEKNKKGTEYACSVERPSGISYLFFETFELELIGATTKEVSVIGENGKELMPSEYMHKKDESKVTWAKEFRSHLTKVEIYGTVRKHKEL